jgi:RNA polymerase sigma-70 factor (sigma-E family)
VNQWVVDVSGGRVDRYEGFREFVLTRGPALSRLAYVLCGDHAAAEDLVQSALAGLASRWRVVAAGGNPEGYARRTMINEHISWWRRRGRRERLVPQPPEGRPAAAADSGLDRLALADALARLAPRQRAVIILRFYEDLSEAETAEVLGVAIGTVKSQTHDGLARLRRLVPGATVEVSR